jgi:hypothetical protein
VNAVPAVDRRDEVEIIPGDRPSYLRLEPLRLVLRCGRYRDVRAVDEGEPCLAHPAFERVAGDPQIVSSFEWRGEDRVPNLEAPVEAGHVPEESRVHERGSAVLTPD